MAAATQTIHAHRCVACAKKGELVYWIHSEACKGVVEAHTCPKCGSTEKGNWQQWLVEPGRLPQVANAHGQINFETLLGYLMLAVGLAILGYCAFVYVRDKRKGADAGV